MTYSVVDGQVEKIVLFLKVHVVDFIQKHVSGVFVWNIPHHQSCSSIFFNKAQVYLIHWALLLTHWAFVAEGQLLIEIAVKSVVLLIQLHLIWDGKPSRKCIGGRIICFLCDNLNAWSNYLVLCLFMPTFYVFSLHLTMRIVISAWIYVHLILIIVHHKQLVVENAVRRINFRHGSVTFIANLTFRNTANLYFPHAFLARLACCCLFWLSFVRYKALDISLAKWKFYLRAFFLLTFWFFVPLRFPIILVHVQYIVIL